MDDLGELGLGGAVAYRRQEREVRGNWKLVIDAFLDGYHIRHLHKDSIYRFFLDVRGEAERGVRRPRISRAVVPRAAAVDDAGRMTGLPVRRETDGSARGSAPDRQENRAAGHP